MPTKKKTKTTSRKLDPKLVKEKLREGVELLHLAEPEVAKVGLLVERLADWSHRNTWSVERHRSVGEAIAAKYDALIKGGVPAELAGQVLLEHVKDKRGQDPLGEILRPGLSMAPGMVEILRNAMMTSENENPGSGSPFPRAVPFPGEHEDA